MLPSVPEVARSLDLRCRPRQQRSVATFDVILDTAAVLLEAHGMRAFNTNQLAESSGVSVRAIYRYFPNKHAVVAELARRMESRWGASMAAVGDLADTSRPWADLWVGYIDAFVAEVRTTPGALAVLSAMRDDPELRAIDELSNRRYIDGITSALCVRRTQLTSKSARAVATVLIRSMVAVLDEAVLGDAVSAAALIETLKLMQLQLLQSVLDGALPRVLR